MHWNTLYLLIIIVSSAVISGSDAVALDPVKAEEIMVQIQQAVPVNYDNVVVEGYLHLMPANRSELNDSDNSDQATGEHIGNVRLPVRSSIKITNSIMEGNIDFDYADFQDEVSFEGTNFTKGLSLRGSVFRNNSIFKGAEFGDYVNFWMAEFDNDASFENVLFKGYADFRCAKFDKIAVFLGNQFYKDAKFYKSEFNGLAYFSMSRFHGDASFGDTQFRETANFDYCIFDKYSDFRYANFGGDADFRGAQFQGSADFRNSILRGDSDFQEAKYGTDFDVRGMKFSILMVNWPSIGDYVISDGPVYLQLIKNFKNLEQFDDAYSCYYKYRLFSMDKRGWSDAEKYLDALAWLTCGFGVRPSFTILWMMIMIVLFAIMYWAIDVFKEQPYPFAGNFPLNMQKATIMDAATDIFRELPIQYASNPSKKTRSTTIVDALIFSAALFFTLPPPLDYIKSRRFRILYVLEDITGWLIMALFLVTLLNIIIRS
jgi:uncharacterized protein YjbI with pentapeptide repeats